MDSATLKALYGTDSEQDILRCKTAEKQVRAVSNGKSGKRVEITPDECKRLCVAAGGVEYLEGYEHRVLQYRITDESVDRYGDVVRARGVRLDNYKKNPVVQFAHNYEEPPVGVSLKTWYDKSSNSVFAWPLFLDDRHDTTGRSELVFRLARANIMRACSIGFTPLDVYRPNADEREKMGMGEYGVEFRKSDLMEFSPVAVPANPNALQDSLRDEFARGLKSAGLTRGHLDTLRRYPILADSAIDALIADLDARKVAVVADDSVKFAVGVSPASYISPDDGDTQTMSETAQTTDESSVGDRAAPIVVNLSCGDIVESVAQLRVAVADTQGVCETLVSELRETLSLVREALADKSRAPVRPAANTKLYDCLKLKQ